MHILELCQEDRCIEVAVFENLEDGKSFVSKIPTYEQEIEDGFTYEYITAKGLADYLEIEFNGNQVPLSRFMFPEEGRVEIFWKEFPNLSIENQGMVKGVTDIDEIDNEKDEINIRLRQNTTKKNLFAISDIETGVLYLLSAANQKSLLIEQIKANEIYGTFNHEEREQLDAALIEAKQLYSMNLLLSQIMAQLSSTYNNVLNNNLNANLTHLNILAILLAVIAVITGFYGMNVKLPIAEYDFAWLYILFGTGVLVMGILIILRNIFPKDKN